MKGVRITSRWLRNYGEETPLREIQKLAEILAEGVSAFQFIDDE
ncbi:MAG TPA: hypothetical protein VI072_13025 [Polyangiaceae bacterium]